MEKALPMAWAVIEVAFWIRRLRFDVEFIRSDQLRDLLHDGLSVGEYPCQNYTDQRTDTYGRARFVPTFGQDGFLFYV